MEIIVENKLVNGVELSIIDQSKKIAGDRWLVKLCGRVLVPWAGWMDDLLAEDGGDVELMREGLGEIVLEMFRERNFISEEEKQNTIDGMVADIQQNMVSYLEKPKFIEKLVAKRISEWRESGKLACLTAVDQELDEDESGPADFSDCFK